MEILLPSVLLLICGVAALGQETSTTEIKTTPEQTSPQSIPPNTTQSAPPKTTKSTIPSTTTELSTQSTPSKTTELSTQSTPAKTTELSTQSTPAKTTELSTQHTPLSTEITNGTTLKTSTEIVSSTHSPMSTADPSKPWAFPISTPHCIILKMSAVVHFDFSTSVLKFELSQNTNVDAEHSNCVKTDNSSHLALRFQESVNSTDLAVGDIIFHFEKEGDKYGLTEVKLKFTYNTKEFGGTTNTSTLFDKVSSQNSYRCDSNQIVNFPENVTLTVNNFQFEAFVNESSVTFMKEQDCSLDDHSSDIVPIAVGIALAALVLIVLLAYLVGRRRNRQRGYQSV